MLNTPEERHIFLIGFFEVLCPWRPMVPMPKRYPFPIKSEYHYYLGGRAAGFITLLLIISGVITLLQEVLL